jgi:hypothetical protein
MHRPVGSAMSICLLGALACNGEAPDDVRGKPCSADGDCGELACAADLQTEPEDLAELALSCGDLGGEGEPGDPCEREDDCGHGVCLLAGACARPCERAGDCSARQRCQPVFARRGPDALQTLTACVAAADLPERAAVEIEVMQDALGSDGARIELPAIGDGETALFVLEHLDGEWPEDGECRPPLCVRSLQTRDDEPVTLFEFENPEAGRSLNPVATGGHLHPLVVMLPIAARSALSPAGYVLELEAARPGDLRLTTLTTSRRGQRLDLNAFYVGLRDLQPEGDRGPPLLADALAVVDEIFAQADIFVGELRQIAVPGELPETGTAFPDGDSAQGFAVLHDRFGVYIELPGLFELSAGAGNPAINLFFVREITPLDPAAEPEAMSGGLPGPLGMHGTGSSGIAISTDMMRGNAEMLGRTLAHEIGHYLGLFHTSELDGSVADPLFDTPECWLDADADGDGLSVADCAEYGADNLMFWAKTTGTQLTPQQREVLQRAAILQ